MGIISVMVSRIWRFVPRIHMSEMSSSNAGAHDIGGDFEIR